MFNDDLIAFIEPAPSRWEPEGWRDVCDVITDIRVDGPRFSFRATLPRGRYRCRIETLPGAFDMDSARIPMVQVPDGKRVLVGPWDLNHLDNMMAMPMAKTYVNGHLLGGLWFAMPGPDKVVENRLGADFGFEVAEDGETAVTLEFVENARDRIKWMDMRSMEVRTDDRTSVPLAPAVQGHPRIYVTADELDGLRQRLPGTPLFERAVEKVREFGDLNAIQDISSVLDIGALVGLITQDEELITIVRKAIVDLCGKPSWSGRPDPLLMGGDNDRGVGFKLYFTGLAWDYLHDAFSADEQAIILGKVEEYLQKMYDFTTLQRGYMGCPSTDPHTLGAWFGVIIACMAFYDDLAIARKALPFFNGLCVDSSKLFPSGGKTAWATFFPKFLVRYLAAAQTFGGTQPELVESVFLDNMGPALLASYLTPNGQEMQRGKRTVEHRELTAYACRFHQTEGIEAIYQAFYDQEMANMGNVDATVFDLLYAPAPTQAAVFPKQPLFVRDIGAIICATQSTPRMAVSFSAGLLFGARPSFGAQPHNRCSNLPMGAIDVQVDGSPVLLNLFGYGLSSALDNAMCIGDGGAITDGMYLPGEIGPERSPAIRRCLITDRFIYAHAVVTGVVHPKWGVRAAERIYILDYQTGCILLQDTFTGTQPLDFATHLHCAGSVTELGQGQYRLTGGQARTIAAPGRSFTGAAGLTDEEKGELFVQILDAAGPYQVVVEEPTWRPSYIYGLNNTGKEDIKDGRHPRYKRWRLAATERAPEGAFLFGISAEQGVVTMAEGAVRLPNGGSVYLSGLQPVQALGCTIVAEAVLVDETAQRLSAVGLRHISGPAFTLAATIPVDVDFDLSGAAPHGALFSPAQDAGLQATGLALGAAAHNPYHPRSRGNWVTAF
jgi:hypothetical protein